MPFATIEVCRRWSDEEEMAIIDAVHAALVAAVRVRSDDGTVRLFVHEPHRFAYYSSRLSDPTLRTLVSVDCLAGRPSGMRRPFSETGAPRRTSRDSNAGIRRRVARLWRRYGADKPDPLDRLRSFEPEQRCLRIRREGPAHDGCWSSVAYIPGACSVRPTSGAQPSAPSCSHAEVVLHDLEAGPDG
jgi:phenylpyruvate tautomerase PptA (4-oxalocrotonate tautomerase family)